MSKRFVSMVLALVLVLGLSFPTTAGASTAVDTASPGDVFDDGTESSEFAQSDDDSDLSVEIAPSESTDVAPEPPVVSTEADELEQSGEIVSGANDDSVEVEQPDGPLDIDEDGYDEVVIEFHPISKDESELEPNESIPSEGNSSTVSKPGETIEPNATSPEDYPITSFTTCWVSGSIANENGFEFSYFFLPENVSSKNVLYLQVLHKNR